VQSTLPCRRSLSHNRILAAASPRQEAPLRLLARPHCRRRPLPPWRRPTTSSPRPLHSPCCATCPSPSHLSREGGPGRLRYCTGLTWGARGWSLGREEGPRRPSARTLPAASTKPHAAAHLAPQSQHLPAAAAPAPQRPQLAAPPAAAAPPGPPGRPWRSPPAPPLPPHMPPPSPLPRGWCRGSSACRGNVEGRA
jgi:hypothetical protein